MRAWWWGFALFAFWNLLCVAPWPDKPYNGECLTWYEAGRRFVPCDWRPE